MILLQNQCIEWDNETINRVLYIDANNTVVVIDIKDKLAWPTASYTHSEIQSAIQSGQARILSEDPNQFLCVPEESFTEKQRQRRDKRWSDIAEIVYIEGNQINPALFNANLRGTIVREQSKKTGCAIDTINDCIRSFLQMGMIQNALIPLGYSNRGGKGKTKNFTKKNGRRSRLETLPGTGQSNVIITEDILNKMRKGYKNTTRAIPSTVFKKHTAKCYVIVFLIQR